MWSVRRRSPKAAIVLIGGCAVLSLYLFERNAWLELQCGTHDQDSPEQFVARFEPLVPLLPKDEPADYLLDRRHSYPERLHLDARLPLARYAVAPRRLTANTGARLVVVDSDRPDVVPQAVAAAHWTLLADLHNGIRLYRTARRQ
jgi:hypothetical protein